ncbi:DUF4179 domain-containing protein [Clostridium sp.]|jgi:hypothetical protein|uniref:DUF4179 domain-containing protein n=1 Tax=Clostridium sp. TaxID=1506 RepID=UPI003EEBEA8E
MDKFDIILKEKAKQETMKFELPVSLNLKIDATLNNINQKRAPKKRSYIAASVAAAIIFSSFTAVYGKNVPIVNKIIDFFQGNTTLHYSGDLQKFEKYSTIIGKTLTENGVNITIDNVSCDDNFLVIFYNITGDIKNIINTNGDMEVSYFPSYNLIVDGKRNYSNNDKRDAYLTSDGNIKGIIRADIGGQSLPENFKLNLLFNTTNTKDYNYEFKMDISKKSAMSNSKVVNINKKATIKYPDREHAITVEKVALTPFGNQIVISEKFKTPSLPLSSDNHDVEIPFSQFALFDDKGNALDVIPFNSITSSLSTSKNSFEFVKAKKDIKSLTLIPIRYISDIKERISPNPINIDKLPLELKMSGKGSLIVDKIEYGDTETRVFYTTKGVVLHYGNFFFVDDKGNNVYKNVVMTDKDFILDRESGLHVAVLPKLEKNMKYKLGYYYDEEFELLEQYKIDIPLN